MGKWIESDRQLMSGKWKTISCLVCHIISSAQRNLIKFQHYVVEAYAFFFEKLDFSCVKSSILSKGAKNMSYMDKMNSSVQLARNHYMA